MMGNNLTVPEKILRNIKQKVPDLNKYIVEAYNKTLPLRTAYPSYTFLPLDIWYDIALQIAEAEGLELLPVLADMFFAGTWQYSKGIYTFDPDLLLALLESAIDGNIPADILTRIPEHCVYIDACGGFFAQLLYDPDLHCPLLGLYGAEQVVFVPLIHGPLDEALDKYRKLPRFQNDEDIIGKFTDEIAAQERDFAEKCLNLILYLCSSEPDITTDRQPGYSRYRAEPVKTKKGLRLFPADRVHNHNVGMSVGAQLRRVTDTGAEVAPIEYQGGTKRAHLRRGHWHGYWKGSRKAEDREFIFHWIPPLIAGGKR